MPEANHREWMRCLNRPAAIGAYPIRELSGEGAMVPDPVCNAPRPEGPDDHPELERPKPVPELEAVIHIVDDAILLGGLQVRRNQ